MEAQVRMSGTDFRRPFDGKSTSLDGTGRLEQNAVISPNLKREALPTADLLSISLKLQNLQIEA
jgi:hypothetical protein